jgi:hypothetical protein
MLMMNFLEMEIYQVPELKHVGAQKLSSCQEEGKGGSFLEKKTKMLMTENGDYFKSLKSLNDKLIAGL